MSILDDMKIEEDAEESFLCTLNISKELVSKGFQVDPSAASTRITIRDNDSMQLTSTLDLWCSSDVQQLIAILCSLCQSQYIDCWFDSLVCVHITAEGLQACHF